MSRIGTQFFSTIINYYVIATLLFTKFIYGKNCTYNFSIDITNGALNDVNKEITHNGIVYTRENYYRDEDGGEKIIGCICDAKPCIRKCCGENERFVNRTCTVSENVTNLQNIFGSFSVVYDKLLCKYPRTRYLIESRDYTITSSGFIKQDSKQKPISPEFYCLEFILSNDYPDSLLCAEPTTAVQSYYSMGMIISMPFLIATFLVYALLPDKNLPAKSLMCYVLSLLFAYIMLVTIQLNSNLEHGACVTIAYLCYFFFMVSFFWMNSSCIDIWLTFSGIKGITGQRTQERKRFIYYCLYSWGLPLIMTSIVVVMTMEHLKDSIFFTAIGDGQCWFKNGLSTGIYFYFPIAILLITNIVLFAITALKIRNVQRDTKVLNAKDSSKHEKDKQRIDEYNSEPCYLIEPVKNRGMQVYDFLDVDNSCLGFNLYIKLLFAMGVNWSMEVISWLVQWQSNNVPTYIWYITDFCNAMYGVLIFFIFVFKKNIWIMLKKRYLQIMGRSTRAHSMGTSTHRTTLFTAISLQSIPGAGLLTKMHSTPNDNRNELRPPKIH
ncbi:G-protein coupled receptor Mth2-like isoform X6 [Onthophagus taurus]|uniref:G-protein coupled receptor Mth2-like isoform X6 n=1 Tax=Onthophagus taurus TaxID=166361 RepID=UPI000C202466|nr:G-protein coupled receptor Mth2-like isoform X6 [Onthophagus taurus]